MTVPRLRWENPILSRELRSRMRGSRAAWILFSYIGLLAVILFISYLFWWNSQGGRLGGGSQAFSVGRTFYQTLFCIQGLLVGLITPSLTSGAISIEREQRTMDMLAVSLLPRRSVVFGKLFAAVSFVGLLLLASLPLASLCFLLGGVSPSEVVTASVLLLGCAFAYGAAGVAWSTMANNTTSATALTYGTNLLSFFATLPIAVSTFIGFTGRGSSLRLIALNPIGAVMSGTETERYFGVGVPAWVSALLVNLLVGTIFTTLAIHRLEMPRRDRTGQLRFLTLVLGLFLTAVGCGALRSSVVGNAGVMNSSVFDIVTLTAMTLIVAPFVLAVIFCTGDGLPEKNGRFDFKSLFRIREGNPASGLVFSLLMLALCGGLLALCIPDRDLQIGFLLLTGTALAVLWGLGTLALWLSARIGSLWATVTTLGAIGAVLYILPIPIFGSEYSSAGTYTTPNIPLYALSPLPAIEAVIDMQITNQSKPKYGKNTLAKQTLVTYGGAGVLFTLLALTHGLSAQRRRREAERAAISAEDAAPTEQRPETV